MQTCINSAKFPQFHSFDVDSTASIPQNILDELQNIKYKNPHRQQKYSPNLIFTFDLFYIPASIPSSSRTTTISFREYAEKAN